MRTGSRLRSFLGIFLAAAAAFAVALIPAWIIQPFAPQTARGLEIAFLVKKWGKLAAPLLALAALLIAIRLWRASPGWWRRPILVILVALAFVSAWFAWQNHFEWLFHSLPQAGFARAQEAGFVEPGDMVLSVAIGQDAAAYPVRQLAYHHLVADAVGGVPLVATY
jgi:hypothetical protein